MNENYYIQDTSLAYGIQLFRKLRDLNVKDPIYVKQVERLAYELMFKSGDPYEWVAEVKETLEKYES